MKERKFTFLGSQRFADFFRIGGMESFIRRLGFELARRGYRVDYLVYGANREKEISPAPRIYVKYIRSLRDALAIIISSDHSDVIRVWMERDERFQYFQWILSTANQDFNVYHLWFCVPDSPIKRLLTYAEFAALSYRGHVFCVSPRQFRLLRFLGRGAKIHLLLPPVPEYFFLKPEEKALKWPIKVTFLGVLHPDKGIKEVIKLFTALHDDPRFKFTIFAAHDSHSVCQRQLHEQLLAQDGFVYTPMERDVLWSIDLEKKVQEVLKETDIFVQPFLSLQNTVDIPLLVLEAMASLCIVLTTQIGSIPEIYGKSPFIIPHKHFIEEAIALLKGIDEEQLRKERLRIYRRNKELGFSQTEVAEKFLEMVEGKGKP